MWLVIIAIQEEQNTPNPDLREFDEEGGNLKDRLLCEEVSCAQS